MKTVETAPHEFAANYVYDDLSVFFACDRRVKDGNGSQKGELRFNGEKWSVTLYYQDSGIKHPGATLPTGTEWKLAEMREFRVAVEGEGPAKKANFHVAPRWQGMQTQDGDEISVPNNLLEGVNIRVQGSNIEFDDYPDLLREALGTVGIARRHVGNREPVMTTVTDAERYVRLHRDDSGPIHARDGPLVQLAHVLENDRDGYRKLVQNDANEKGRNLPGYYHTVTLGPERISEAWPDHRLPKEIKHYYSREAASMDPEHDALAHPKLGASYQVSRWDETLTADPDDLERLNEELEQAVLSVLAAAGIDVAPAGHGDESDDDLVTDGGGLNVLGPYVEDAYFEPETSDAGPDPTALNLTEIQREQEHIVVKHLADGLTETQEGILGRLVTDGGKPSPNDLADELDYHPDTIRRNLRKMSDLVDHTYGAVSLASQHVADLVVSKVREAREHVEEAMDTVAKAKEAEERGLDESTAAFVAWCAKHDVDISNREDALHIRLDERPNQLRRWIHTAFARWKDAGRDEIRFRTARISWPGGGTRAGYWLSGRRR